MRNRMEKENDVTTFTEDQIKKIRETLGDEAVAKLTLPKVRVPKYVSGQWLEDHAQIGVTVSDSDGDTATYCEDGNWDGYGYSPSAHSTRAFAIVEWPNGEIYDNLPDLEPIKVDSGLKAGGKITSVEQLKELPPGSIVAFDEYSALNKAGAYWKRVYGATQYSSEDVLQIDSNMDLHVLRVGWES